MFIPNKARVDACLSAVKQWAADSGFAAASDVATSYLGARGGYVIVAVDGLIEGVQAEAMVSLNGVVRSVFVPTADGSLARLTRPASSVAA